MGRKKRRRGRDRTLEAAAGGGVETIDLELDDVAVEPVPSRAQAPAEALPASPEAAPVPADPGPAVQTLGELLQQAREARGLAIEEASARTRISALMLQHLESDHFGEFAADAYVKGFLRNYGTFLGLDVAMLLRRYEAISGRLPAREPELLEVETPSRRRVHRQRGRAWIVVVACAAAALLCWVFWSRGAARLGLRPTPGLEQIETQLQETTTVVPPAPPDAASADDRAHIQDKWPVTGLPSEPVPLASVPPKPAPAPTLPAAGRRASGKSSAPARPVARPKPTERGPIEDLVPATPR